jgi:hypothetical protein
MPAQSRADDSKRKAKRARDRWLPLKIGRGIAPDHGIASAFCGGHVDHLDSSPPHAPRKALGPSSTEMTQSYFLLAVGILIAIAVPFLLLRASAAASSAGPATATSSP